MSNLFRTFLRVLIFDKASLKFAAGVLVGLAFSIAVILCTIGIMDGFEWSLKKGLKGSVGDIYFYSRDGFFDLKGEVGDQMKNLEVKEFAPVVQTESFLIHDETSKGVLVKGVAPKSFKEVTGIDLKVKPGEIAVGSELLKALGVKVGGEVVMALANGNGEFSDLPLLNRYRIGQIIHHGVYQKDLRHVYIHLEDLQSVLDLDDRINVVVLNVPEKIEGQFDSDLNGYMDKINHFRLLLRDALGIEFAVKPFWSEFSALFKAVKVEKFMIGLILQLVVIISIFNVLAFIIFLNEKRSREIFLFKALGFSQGKVAKGWTGVLLLTWLLACSLSIVFVMVFNWALQHLAVFNLPGDVYHLGRVVITLSWKEYALVFSGALVWLVGISWFGLRKIRKNSILQGLRKEFA